MANGFHAFHPGDPRHDGTEDHRSNHHFNQLNEGVAEGFHLRAQFRVQKWPSRIPIAMAVRTWT
ncbi:hypothetical protein MJ390_28360 [Klebsiella pneumoniae]|nr:hypothetical protein MJ390_28360 [Klebsiella pneumoniae]